MSNIKIAEYHCKLTERQIKDMAELHRGIVLCRQGVMVLFLAWWETLGQMGKIHSHGRRTSMQEVSGSEGVYVCMFASACNKRERLKKESNG